MTAVGMVRAFPDGTRLAEAAAMLIVEEAVRAVERWGRFTVALGGGSSPRETYALLTESPVCDAIPWDESHFFWGDERCVDSRDPRSNERMARDLFLDHLPVPREQIHPMRCGGTGTEEDALATAEGYEALLRGMFESAGRDAPRGLDLVILGLGDDGHTASLFPGSAAAAEREKWVTVSYAEPHGPDSLGPVKALGTWRVTLTASFINMAETVVFLVSGATKPDIVRRVLEGVEERDATLPARLIRPASGRLYWFLDNQAAALVPSALRNGGLARADACARPREGAR